MAMMTMLAALAATAARPCSLTDRHDADGLRAAEARWVHMLETRDLDGLACLLAAEFTDINWAGQRVPRAQILAALPHRPNKRLALSEIEVMLHGDVGIVHGLNRQMDGAGRAIGAVRFTDIFLYRDRRWQAVSAQESVVRDPARGG